MRHVNHLLIRYVHGQLRPAQRARVVNHVRECPACREALAREDRLISELRREMPAFGQPRPAQLARVWAGVCEEVSPGRQSHHGFNWLPGLSLVLAVMLVLVVALPVLAQSGVRVEAAPRQARPVSTSSPTPGVLDTIDTSEAPSLAQQFELPQATIAYAVSPAPMPEATVSPEARRDGLWR